MNKKYYSKIKSDVCKNGRFIVPRNKGVISNSITQNWTDQAIICFISGHNCKECTIGKANFSFVCQMKKVTKILLKELGLPDRERMEKLLS